MVKIFYSPKSMKSILRVGRHIRENMKCMCQESRCRQISMHELFLGHQEMGGSVVMPDFSFRPHRKYEEIIC